MAAYDNIFLQSYFFFIIDLPEDGPTIETPRKQYQVGETADLMCIAQNSNPATNLSWYINGEPVRDIYLFAKRIYGISEL